MPGATGGRKPGSYEWYEIQDNTAYWESFEQAGKVVFPDIAETTQFAWDEGKHYLGNTGYMAEAGKWIVAVLNSSSTLWFYRQISNMIRGGYLRFISQYVEQIPIPFSTPTQQSELEKCFTRILAAKKAGSDADVSAQEREIDQIVYQLYGLTAEEIRVVEGECISGKGV